MFSKLPQTAFGFLTCAVIVFAAPSVFADNGLTTEQAAAAEATAMSAKFKFKAGKFDEAAPLFLQAFAMTRKPALLYNAARAYEEAGKPAEAKVAFEQYLGLPDVTAAGQKDAKKHIAALKAKIADATKAKSDAEKSAAEKSAAEKSAAEKSAAEKSAAAQRAAAAEKDRSNGADGPTKANASPVVGTGPSAAATVGKTAAAPARSRWVTYGIGAGAGVFLLVGIANQLQAAQSMADANAMEFRVDNKFDPASVDAVKSSYNSRVATAESQQGSALTSFVLAAGLGGWLAYRLLTPDPGLAEASGAANQTTNWRPNGGVQLHPTFELPGTGSATSRLGLALRGRF